MVSYPLLKFRLRLLHPFLSVNYHLRITTLDRKLINIKSRKEVAGYPSKRNQELSEKDVINVLELILAENEYKVEYMEVNTKQVNAPSKIKNWFFQTYSLMHSLRMIFSKTLMP